MVAEKSCGAVVYTEIEGKNKYLLIKDMEGIYGFPKGHMEENENETDTALREIREEVGIEVELCPDFRTTDSHMNPKKKNTMKEMVYFLGFYKDQTPVYQKEELTGASLYSYEEAMKLFQFDSSKRILTEANEYLRKRGIDSQTR